MGMEPISETLRDLLVRQGIANGRAGTRATRRNKRRAAANTGAVSQVSGLEGRPIYLCWSNPHMTKRTTKRACLVICE